jgi:[ribosomal protein S18]-alanine N-acetyltransferase
VRGDSLCLGHKVMHIGILPALPSDAADLAALHAQALPPGWPAADFAAYCAAENRIVLKASDAAGLLGFAVLQIAADEAELLSIAVAKEAQQRGIGSAILAACVAACELKNISYLYLDVAEGNGAALKLYGKFGFEVLARRPNYYQTGRAKPETALIMRLGTKWASSGPYQLK